MKKMVLILAAVAMVSVVRAQECCDKTYPYVDVQGNVERYVEPDEIYVGITIDEADSKGKVALSGLEATMLKTLTAQGIDVKKNLTVMDMASGFMPKKNDVLLSKSFRLKLSSAQQLGNVVVALEAAGVSNVSVIKTSYSKMAELKAELRVEAIQFAQTKARQLAEAIGQTIKKAAQINDYDNAAPEIYMDSAPMLARSMKSNSDYSAPDLEFNKIKVTYRVSARFILW